MTPAGQSTCRTTGDADSSPMLELVATTAVLQLTSEFVTPAVRS